MTDPARDTIYALSTGSPPAAIAVIRLSGPRADAALRALAGKLTKPRCAALVRFRDPASGEELDRGLALRFPGPDSFTGEDLVELHLHGGRSVVAAVQRALAAFDGLREAEPGEFTRRAFENGRIDLAEAEGLADLLEAETEAQRRSALAMAGGALSRRVAEWQARLLDLAAQVEASLDFADEADVGDGLPEGWHRQLDALAADVAAWLARPSAERLKDGIRVVIAGPPNSGKSSLLNCLVGRDAAITSSVPGTTRDVLEAPIAIAGIPFLLCDTAGLRNSEDAIETIGIERARQSLDQADLILWLGDPSEAPETGQTLMIQSKCDVEPPSAPVDVRVSAVTGEGIDKLAELVRERSNTLLPQTAEVAINRRQRSLLSDALDHLWSARRHDPILAAEALRLTRNDFDRITGRAGVEDMLDALFGRFCIGK